MNYQVQKSFIAVRNEPTRPSVFVTIAEGSIITVIGELQHSGLVDVRYDGEIVAAFMRDIEARAVPVEASMAV